MVATNQLVTIALIIGVGYVAITYGPDIMDKAKKAFDTMYWTLQQPGSGVKDTTLPQPQTYQPPPVYGNEVVPEGGTQFNPTPPYGSESTQGPQQVTGPQTGAFDPTSAPGIGSVPNTPQAPVPYQDYTTPLPTGKTPSTANVPIITQPAPIPPAVPSQQHLAAPVKSKTKTPKPTLTNLQQQQAHLQNTRTSRGNISTPKPVTVSQAHPSTGPTPTRPAPRPIPASTPGHGVLPSRFPVGSQARSDIDYQMGCTCIGKQCCFRGHQCDGQVGHECTTATSAAKAVTDRACASLRQKFLNENPCNTPAAPTKTPVVSRRAPITPAPCAAACAPFKNSPQTYNNCCKQHRAQKANAGYAFGDGGEIISLDSMFVTIA